MRAYPLTSVPPKPLVRFGRRSSHSQGAKRRSLRALATLPIVFILVLVGASAAFAAQATVVATGLTEPSGAIVDPDGHIWVSDGSGFCETTATDGASGTPGTLVATVCDATAGGVPAAADGGNVVLIPDGKRQASIHRLTWDSTAHSFFPDGEIALGEALPAAVSIGPDGAAYVSFTRQTNVERIADAAGPSPGVAQEIGTSLDARPAAMVAGWDSTHTKTVVYIAESKGGVSELDPSTHLTSLTEFGAATLGATPPQLNALTYDPGTDTLFGATAIGAASGFPDTIASMSVADEHVQDASAATGYSNVGGLAVGGSDRILAVDDPSGTGVAGVGRLLSTGVADTAAPSLTIDSPFEGVTTSSSPSIAFHANESASFSCRLDAGAFAPCSSPATIGGLAPGGHTVDVQATDLAGNVSPVVSRHFTVRAPAAMPAGTAATPAGQIPGAGGLTAGAGAGAAGGVLGAVVDHTAPRLSLSPAGGRIRLVGNTISLPFRCSETCTAKATGTISVKGSARLFKLAGATKVVQNGRTVRLVVTVPRSAVGSIRRALRAHRVVTLRLSLRAEDLAGNARTSSLSVRVSG
jgi:hypothetical protein